MSNHLPTLTIAAYTHDLWEHVCPRVRLLSPANASGINVIQASRSSRAGLQIDLNAVARAEIVFILRDFPRDAQAYGMVMGEAKRLGKKVVYELDDLLFDLPPSHPDTAFYREIRFRLLEAAVDSDAIIVTTENLRRALNVYNPHIYIFPNYIDPRLWHRALTHLEPEAPDRDPLVIGYQGGRGHIPDLETILPALIHVLQRYGPRVKLKFWGAPPPEALRVWPNIEWLDAGLTDYAAFTEYFQRQDCDIFLAPVIDNPFNACKSPLKFLEYSLLRTAGIYSRCAPYDQVVTEGTNGLLASTPEDWENSLVHLIEDSPLRQSMGRAAYDTVRQNWLLDEHAASFRTILEQVLAQPPRAEPQAALRDLLDQADRWQMELESTLREQARQIDAQASRLNLAETDLSNIKNGIGWNLLQKTHGVVQRLAPAGTARAHWVGQGLDLLRRLRHRESVRARLKLRRGETLMIYAGDDLRPVVYQPTSDVSPETPLVSLLFIQTDQLPTVSRADITQWVLKQTWQNSEIIDWMANSADWQGEAHGKYVCVVSSDLLRQGPSYLEINLLALESEGLAFTVNALIAAKPGSNSHWFRERISAGSLPGDARTPLLRAITRRDCLTADLEIDLSGWLADWSSRPVIAGRIITNVSSFPDHQLSFPFNHTLKGGGVHLLDANLVAYPFASEVPTGAIYHRVQQPVPLAVTPVADKRPTVLMVMPFLAVGGAERIHIYMMRGLADKIRFVIVTLEPLDPALGSTEDEFLQSSAYIYHLPVIFSPPLYEAGFDYLIERFQPQTLYIANGATWIYNHMPRLKQRHPGLRVVNQVYDHVAGWINRYNPELVRAIDGHIGSNYDIDRAYVAKGARKDQVYHIENGIDTTWYDPEVYDAAQVVALRDRLRLPRDRKVVTFIARLHPQKRPLDFVELARRCAQDTNLHFLMVGDGPLSEAVNQEIRHCRLTNLTRLPFYSPSRDIYAASDVMMLTSEYEGMPMVVLEAQSMGKPFVSTQVGNIRQVLEKTGGGLAVTTPGDINGLIASIRQVLEHPIDPTAVRAVISAQYGLEKMAQEYATALLPEKNA